MKSEMKMPRDRDWEVKYQKKSREFSRNETLAGYCKQCIAMQKNLNWVIYIGFGLQRRNVTVISRSTLPRCSPNSHSSHTVRPNQTGTRHTCRQPSDLKSETREFPTQEYKWERLCMKLGSFVAIATTFPCPLASGGLAINLRLHIQQHSPLGLMPTMNLDDSSDSDMVPNCIWYKLGQEWFKAKGVQLISVKCWIGIWRNSTFCR